MLFVFQYFICIVMGLVGLAFITLIERNVMRYIQLRKGPNKVGYMGLLQPFSDAVKLFCKELVVPYQRNLFLFLVGPILRIFLILLVWLVYPRWEGYENYSYRGLFLFCILGVGVYGLFVSGWAGNSKYRMLGSLRSISQTISYEVSLIILILSYFILMESLRIKRFFKWQDNFIFCLVFIPLFFIWSIRCLAELNRTPFDFSEGESELVSGFNTEYRSGPFSLIFIAEYGFIFFMRLLNSFLFLGSSLIYLKSILFLYFIL